MIASEAFQNRVFARNGGMGKDACDIMAAAIQAVDPYRCVNEQLSIEAGVMSVGGDEIRLDDFQRIFLIGFGKASVPMAKALIDALGSWLSSANVITKDDSFLAEDGYKGLLKIYIGEHPVPDDRSIESTRAVLESLPELTPNDLVLVVISGGGSALFTNPMPGITLDDIRSLTDSLLKCGADIYEINTLRKHLDRVKGGGLVSYLQPAMVQTFILSDVIGDSLEVIASGPTVPDSTSYSDALEIIDRYNLKGQVPKSIMTVLEGGMEGKFPETLKADDIQAERVRNHLVGSNLKAARAAKEKASSLGYNSLILSTQLTGLTKEIVDDLDEIIQRELSENKPAEMPACLIFGGETTVEVTGDGKGGRNQDLVLRMVPRLADREGVLFISLATDGEDGPTDAAGAASDALVFREGTVMRELDITTYITTSNSYQYLDETDALIRIGSTGTNVNDLVIILLNDRSS